MASKKEKKIINKIRILLTQDFASPEDAFNFFDKKGDGVLDKDDVMELLKKAKVSRFLRGLVADKLLDKFDADTDQQISWPEFKQAVIDIG